MIFQTSNLTSTSELTKNMDYFDSPIDFFKNFSNSWDEVQFQTIKFERYQTYKEVGNKSWELLINNEIEESIKLLPKIRSSEFDLYWSIKKRGVDFIRCRPVVFPLSTYLKWEIESYDINSLFGEKIFFFNFTQDKEIINNIILHDFMVFDKSVAYIHNYNESGEIVGGWKSKNKEIINALIYLFYYCKTISLEYKYFLLKNNNE